MIVGVAKIYKRHQSLRVSHRRWLMNPHYHYGFSFKLIFLMSTAKQIIPTYINYSCPLILDGIYLIVLIEFWEEREARPILIWYYFYNVFDVTRSRVKPTTSCSWGERSNHWATAFIESSRPHNSGMCWWLSFKTV